MTFIVCISGGYIAIKINVTSMKKYRIDRYGLYDHIFDVQVKKWYGWVLIKKFKADISNVNEMIDNIIYAKC